MIALASLHALRAHLGLTSSAEDERLLFALDAATALLQTASSRRLLPVLHTQALPVRTHDPATISLYDDLLELLSLSDGTEMLSAAQLRHERDGTLRRADRLPFSGDLYGEVQVTAFWGFHPQPEQAWQAVTTLAAELSEAGDSLLCTETGSAAAPLFAAGQLLRIGDELLSVVTVDLETDSVSVRRGVQGSTTVLHSSGSAVSQYTPPPDLVRLCLRLAHWLYREADDPTAVPPADLTASASWLRRIRV